MPLFLLQAVARAVPAPVRAPLGEAPACHPPSPNSSPLTPHPSPPSGMGLPQISICWGLAVAAAAHMAGPILNLGFRVNPNLNPNAGDP